MAYVGLRKPIIAEITGAKVYGEPFAFGKAIGLQVTPNYAEGSLNADDAQVEYDKEFNYAEVTLNTSTIPIEAHEKMFGHKVNEGKTGATFNKDDQAKYVGMGWISVEKVDGVRKFIGNVLYKVKDCRKRRGVATCLKRQITLNYQEKNIRSSVIFSYWKGYRINMKTCRNLKTG